ncbi:MAG TPA: porin family protein [Bacteroidales bacterium]|nr:porin family protein [Bacteroidales bacterium]HPT12451.1 porin family protein [Bacteroidales bacterium]
MKTNTKTSTIRTMVLVLLVLIPLKGFSQPGGFYAPIRIGIHCDPLISWMNTNTTVNSSEGVRPGFDFGVNFYRYFAPNYAISTGIGFMNAGGRQSSTNTILILFPNGNNTEVLPGKEVVYKLKYLTVPFGLKLQTNQIGYLTFFSDIGFDTRILLSSRINIPSEGIENESGQKEVKPVNFGWHVTFGGEYSLGGSTALTGGIGFDDNFFDVTKDNGNANQEQDRSLLKFLRFRLGVIF